VRPEQLATVSSWRVLQPWTSVTRQSVFRFSRESLRTGTASDDHDKKGRNLQTFNPLFPASFYFRQAILNDPLNEMVLHPKLTVRMGHSIALNGEWAWFWLRSSNDGIYGLPSNLLQPFSWKDERYI
jgi:hypothetical protein